MNRMQKGAASVRLRAERLALAPREAYRLFCMSSDLADALEEILESRASYNREFLTGLRESLKQARGGSLRRIEKLADLS
ncbi:MAG: hypothetical protein ABSB82_17610 [Terriglobia bacterium]